MQNQIRDLQHKANQLIVNRVVSSLPERLSVHDCRTTIVDIVIPDTSQTLLLQAMVITYRHECCQLCIPDDDEDTISRLIRRIRWLNNCQAPDKRFVNYRYSLTVDHIHSNCSFELKATELIDKAHHKPNKKGEKPCSQHTAKTNLPSH